MVRKRPPQKILLVEGDDDKHMVRHLWDSYHPKWQPFEIEVKKNVVNLIKSISAESKAPGRQTIGILVDSNDDRIKRWTEITRELERARGIQMPEVPAENGFIINDSKLRIGVWLMPDNVSTGELEDFICELIPERDTIWPRAKRYIDEIPAADRKFKDRKKMKAKVYAWLATRKRPGLMGVAITIGDLNPEAPIAKKFCRWLHQLFGETT